MFRKIRLFYQTYRLLGLLILFGAFLRVFLISNFPVHLNHDEISQLYDAISIAQTFKDAYGNFLPVIFYSVHDFKPPLYTYLTSLTYLILGNHEWIIRVPGVFFGVLLVPATYFFSRTVFNHRLGVVSALIAAISPWEIFYSRKSFEGVIGLFFLLIGFGLLQRHLNSTQNRWVYWGLIFLAISMYTYFSYILVVPLLLLSLLTLNFQKIIDDRRRLIRPLLLFCILVLPIVMLSVTNLESRYRSETVFITQDPGLGEYRNSELSDNSWLNYFYKQKHFFDYVISRYLQQFDFKYLFIDGLDLTGQSLDSGPLLIFLIPFLLVGLGLLIRKSTLKRQRNQMFILITLGMVPSGVTFEQFSPHRVLVVFEAINIIGALGVVWVYDWLKKTFSFWPALLALIVVGFLSLGYFLHLYLVNFPQEKSQYLHYPFEEVSQYLRTEYENFDQIILDPKFGEDAPVIGTGAHYYLAYYINYSPERFQQEFRLGDQSVRETLFGKFSIRAVNWADDRHLKNSLVIVSPWSVPLEKVNPDKVVRKFYFYNRRLAFYAIRP